jgi:oligopeptide transport system permease protein
MSIACGCAVQTYCAATAPLYTESEVVTMLKYVFKRFLAMLFTLFIIISLGFCVIRLMPGSVYDNPEYSDALVAELEKKAHLDRPIIVQYWYFLKGLVTTGDWGVSLKISPGVPVFRVIRDRIPVTVQLNLLSLLISLPLGILFGTLAALQQGKLADNIISIMVVLGISVPSFVFASAMQYFLAYKLDLFEIIYQSTGSVLTKLNSMFLPVMALAMGSIATVCRYLRGELIETMSSEFMLLARTKGLRLRQAIARHAFRNSCIPLTNIIVSMFTGIMGGSMVVERVFSIPGVGGIMVNSINANDHWLTIAILFFYSVISLGTVLLVDIAYAIIDPRIRLEG